MKRARAFTLLVVPHGDGDVRRVRISRRRLRHLAVGAGVLVGLVGVAVLSWASLAARAGKATLLERENARLAAENRVIGEIVANLERAERARDRIRDLAGLTDRGIARSAPERLTAGAGAPSASTAGTTAASAPVRSGLSRRAPRRAGRDVDAARRAEGPPPQAVPPQAVPAEAVPVAALEGVDGGGRD